MVRPSLVEGNTDGLPPHTNLLHFEHMLLWRHSVVELSIGMFYRCTQQAHCGAIPRNVTSLSHLQRHFRRSITTDKCVCSLIVNFVDQKSQS
jgi:hypothetical protein